MRIRTMDTMLVDLPTVRAHRLGNQTLTTQTLVVLRVRTDEGLEGTRRGDDDRRPVLWRLAVSCPPAPPRPARLLLLHGAEDPVVPPGCSVAAAQILQRNGYPAEVTLYEGLRHTIVEEQLEPAARHFVDSLDPVTRRRREQRQRCYRVPSVSPRLERPLAKLSSPAPFRRGGPRLGGCNERHGLPIRASRRHRPDRGRAAAGNRGGTTLRAQLFPTGKSQGRTGCPIGPAAIKDTLRPMAATVEASGQIC